MKKYALGLAALVMSGAVMASQDMPKIVNKQLLVDGKPFVVKGMVYAPESLGFPGNKLTGSTQHGWAFSKGAWMCSQANQYDANDWTKSACEDSDMFGVMKIKSAANQNYNDAVRQQWTYDFKNLKDMGVNTIRLYNINPTGRIHTDFLDQAANNGIYVLYPVLTDWMSKPENFNNTKVVDAIKEVCGKKAILGFMVGNEFPIADKVAGPARLKNITQAIADVRQYCPGALVSYAAEDNPSLWAVRNGESDLMKLIPDVDFVTVNAGYRGDASTPSNDYMNLFKDAKELGIKYNKPLLVGEVGVYDFQDSTFNRKWFNYFWKLMVEHMKDSNVMGAVYFEYNDEPIGKTLSGAANDAHMGVTASAVPVDKNGKEVSKSDFGASKNILKDSNYTGIGKDRYTYMNNLSPKEEIDFCNYQHDCKKAGK